MFRAIPLSIIRFLHFTHSNGICHKVLLTERGIHPDPTHKLSANLYDIYVYHCCVYSVKFLMMDRETVRNVYSFIPKINLRSKCT